VSIINHIPRSKYYFCVRHSRTLHSLATGWGFDGSATLG